MARLLAGQTAIVTGASKGIGRAIVRHLLELGVNVVAVARNEYGLERLQEEMRVGKRLLAVACDIRDSLEVERLFEVATDRFGRLEIVINNAGVGAFAPIEEIDELLLDEILDTNLKAVFHMCRAAFGHMKRHGGGQIVNIAALLGVESQAHASAYCASKWGVMGLSEALHLEGRPHGIRVATIAPGPVQTDFAGASSPYKQAALRPETVAEGVAYLLTQSDDIRMAQLVLR